jgi:hypothetical protein
VGVPARRLEKMSSKKAGVVVVGAWGLEGG